MNEIKEQEEMIFENIKHIDEYGNEYWLARELMPLLEYVKWQKFQHAIELAKIACKNSKNNIDDHFTEVGKMIKLAKGAQRNIKDYKLSRYACYLIVQNGDTRKKAISLTQTYFAAQARKQELSEKEYSELTDDEKRFYQRDLTRINYYSLNIAAKNSGVKNFDEFHDAGYKGLYNGETANDIAKRKGLSCKEDLLDNMDLAELAANLFRISQTESKLKRDNIKDENNANKVHYEVGKLVREAIENMSGTMPEDLPTPDKSLKELERENLKLKNTD